MLAIATVASMAAGCGGGGGGGGDSASTGGISTPAVPTLVTAAAWTAADGALGWAGRVRARLDGSGGLHLIAPLAVQPVGATSTDTTLVYGKRSTTGWSALSGLPKADPQDIAIAVNAAGAAVVATQSGGQRVMRFMDATGTVLGTASAPATGTGPAGTFGVSMLAGGEAVFARTEARSGSDPTLVARVYKANRTGGLTALGDAPTSARTLPTFLLTSPSTPTGVLLDFVDKAPNNVLLPVLGMAAGTGDPMTFTTAVTNDALTLFTGDQGVNCTAPWMSLSSVDTANARFAGILRVIALSGPGGTTTCGLRFFRNQGSATLAAVALDLPDVASVVTRAGVMPAVHIDASERSTIVWAKSVSSSPVIELVKVSATNAVSSPVTVAASSPLIGTIDETSVSYSQNARGDGALAFTTTGLGTPSFLKALYVAKYTPEAGFTAPVRVLPPTNAWIDAGAAVIDAAGNATVVSTGVQCSTTLAVTATTLACPGTRVPTVYTYAF